MRWFWAVMAPAIGAAWLGLRGRGERARYYARRLSERGGALPPASVIVPVKGPEEGLEQNLAALASLDYPDYELIAAAREAADIPEGTLPEGARAALSGPGDADTSEKISNLLAGVAAARPESEIFAFADSDGRVSPGWLAALARAAGDGAATGYRWYVPNPPDFWSLVRSVWNGAMLTLLGPAPAPLAWGGAMAIRREQFDRLGIARRWSGEVDDDYTLADAVRAAGRTVSYAPGALVACPDHTTAAELFRFTRRQLILTRVYRPRLWWLALVTSIVYCGAMTAGLAMLRRRPRAAGCALALLLVPGALKGRERARLARTALPQYTEWFRRYGWVHTGWAPLGSWVWLAACLASARAGEIEWRGRRYRLRRAKVLQDFDNIGPRASIPEVPCSCPRSLSLRSWPV